MVRHGYQRCDACHASPDGGGVLTAYGRALSREVLSTWGTERETEFLYGAITLPEWLALGGDVRVAQTHVDSPTIVAGRTILMQADAEAALTFGRFKLVGTLGYQTEVLSRRHFLLYRPSDGWTVRAGRFLKAYGIRLPDHIVEIRRGLGWDQGTETYNLEVAHFGEGFETFATASAGRPDRPSVGGEQGAGFRGAVYLGERYKAGVSYWYGSDLDSHSVGPYAVLGFSPRLYALAEIDFQKRAGASTRAATYLKLAYEPVQGLLPYVTHELAQGDTGDPSSRRHLYTIGLQWFPRPHLELLGAYQRQAPRGGPGTDYFYAMLHYYL